MPTTRPTDQRYAERQYSSARQHNRRGITLLFVVSMIVLFLLMGTTFVVISNDYLKSARRRGHNGLQRDAGTPLLERAFYELARGPSLFNTTSPLRGQSLLGDLYGYGFKARVRTVSAIDSGSGSDTETGGQFLEMTLKSPVAPNYNANRGVPIRSQGQAGDEANLSTIPDFYNGLLATFTTNKGAGATVRIVDYDPTTFTFRISPVWQNLDSDQKDVFHPTNPFAANAFADLIDSEIVVNGAPFAGTGSGGFDVSRTGPQLTDKALQPNRRGEAFGDLIAGSGVGYLSNDNAPNEPWDAADYQNMFLAYGDGSTIPSFYRQYLSGPGSDFREFPQAPNRGINVDNDGDGVPDGIWMDIGLPVQTDATGRYIKPLVSYKVIDLDGRLNLNAAGSLADTDASNMGFVSQVDNFLQIGPTTGLPRGQGYGPGEISLKGVLDTDYAALLRERYGFDGQPGVAGRDNRSAQKLFGYPTDNVGNVSTGPYGTRGRLFASSSMDIHGRFAVGTPAFTFVDYRDPNNPNFPNGLPGIDMLGSNLNSVTNLPTEIGNSPYEMNFAMSPFGDANDAPFTPQEFERLLRTQDRDVYMLPQRLWDLAPMAFQDPTRRDAVATESWSIPTLPISQGAIIAVLANRIASNGIPIQDAQNQAVAMLPPEFLLGLKMNVNREFGNGLDDDANGLVDEPGEINRDSANRVMTGFTPEDKQNFARQLFVLTLLFAEPAVSFPVDIDGDGDNDADDYAAMIAQWCVNVVDFRDPDSIMTTVEFDKNPFDGWNVDGDVGTNEADSLIVRGCERPELLLTEGIAFHDRRTEDESIGGMAGMGDSDFDNRLRPQAAAFIELYNPWTQNRLNQELPYELYGNQPGVDLRLDADANNGGGSPVWRLAVRRYADPGQPQQNLLRAVYFTNDWSDVAETDPASNVEVFTSSQVINPIQPGSHAVIGTGDPNMIIGGGYMTPIGRRDYITRADEGSAATLDIDRTRSISLLPDSNLVRRYEWDGGGMNETSKTAVAIVLDSPRPFNLSDPQFGYPDAADPALSTFIGDGYEYLAPYNRPLDGSIDRNRNDDDIEAIWTNGTSVDFRTVDLQRLADPTRAWDAVYNPYVTIDSMSVNLVGYNGVQNDPNNNNMTSPPDPGVALSPVLAGAGFKTDFRAYERGYRENASRIAEQERLLWPSDNTGRRTPPQTETTAIGDGHNLSFEFVDSFGETNDWDTDPAVFAQPLGYPWLQWNNRPYVSQLELANVPIVGPDKLTQQFTIDDGTVTDPYNSILCPFGHMPNMTNTNMSLFRVLDFLEVPSRFVGTEQYLNGDMTSGGGSLFESPFNYLSRYRVPGKINLNTISSPLVWEGLMREYGAQGFDGGLDFVSYKTALGVDDLTRPPNVFKPFNAHRYVPPSYFSSGSDVETGLFRPDSGSEPLFDFEPSAQMAFNNTDRSPYFRNQMRQRLGNLVTNQSNVFAIWITIGYFEYDPSPGGGYVPVDSDPTNDYLSEVGNDLGESKRSRAFYIFDRSIPMGFEPGRNHNVDRGILVKSIIDE